MRRFVIGDIHGNFKALMQCLERSDFDYNNDIIISLGDIVDGYSQSKECVEELLKIKNGIFIRGNHDQWFLNFINNNQIPHVWYSQGGKNTLTSYASDDLNRFMIDSIRYNIPDSHIDFFRNQVPYYLSDDNLFFVHGGFNRKKLIKNQTEEDFYWDRDLIQSAYMSEKIKAKISVLDNFDTVFVGHTTTQRYYSLEPLFLAEKVWAMDTGAGWSGKLSIMDIDTKEFYQSDLAFELYPGEKAR